jgi:Na+/H+ antiporter NhaA
MTKPEPSTDTRATDAVRPVEPVRTVDPLAGRTHWARALETPLRRFLRTETGGAAVLLAATLIALAWVNLDRSSYEALWQTTLSVRLGHAGIEQGLRGWVNTGLMAFYFFVVGLEARREFDLGELRERRRLALPILAGLGGMIIPIGLYLAITAGRPSAHGWGIAMSTDTAFALGMLALIGRKLPAQLRVFLLTVSVVDDIASLAVIGVAYSESVRWVALLTGLAIFAVMYVLRSNGVRSGPLYLVLGIACWTAVFEAGIEPVVVGLAMGLITFAYPVGRDALARATDLFRQFREQPTPELARSARVGLATAVSPNDRLQQFYHSWTSYAIVPLFALANAGVAINGSTLAHAFSSPITVGIVVGYVVGKPVGMLGFTWLVTTASRGRLRPPVGWAAVAGSGAVAGIGFTVALLVASLAFTGPQLDQAKLGILAAALLSSGLSWLVFRVTLMLPKLIRIRALAGTSAAIVDLAVPVDSKRDHIRGPHHAPVTVVEYGDFECPYCGRAEPIVRELLTDFGDVRYVWRNLPLADVHPQAQLAAEAAEAAGRQGDFWGMHDALLDHQEELGAEDLIRYAEQLGLDMERFNDDLAEHIGAARVAADVDSADQSGVSGTPTFFINGQRHYGAYDIETLSAAVKTARIRFLAEFPNKHPVQ